ncbi:hypothetical protein [Falsirhodobacter sp. 1013]|uniref:hypothetical protein n=1 Tax=Falsirhodobacter sp. 1013 TaxID=3417566 RepID=UPI003EB9C838
MTRKRNFRDIEEDLDQDRAQLGSIFDNLFNRSTVDILMREAMHTMRANGGARETAEAVIRRNPMAAGVVGLGLAWMLFGSTRKTKVEEDVEEAKDDLRRTDRRARRFAEEEVEAVEDSAWADAMDRLRARASIHLRELEEDAAAYKDDLAAGLSEKADEVRDFVAERAAILSDLAEDLRERFAEGLDEFSATARERIIKAREEAYAARLKAQEALGKSGREAKRVVEDHPMVSAAVVLALGTAIGTAVYRGRRSTADRVAEDLDDAADAVEEEARTRWRRHKARRG